MRSLLARFGACCTLAALLLPLALLAQDATGTIAGVIADPLGGHPAGEGYGNQRWTTLPRKVPPINGFYQVQHLPIGNYQVTVETPGFLKAASASSALDINQTLRIDMKLQIGQVSDVVTVESQASTVETQISTVGGTVTGQAIFELPLNGRNTLDLLATQPGVTLTNPDNGGAGNYSIGGGRTIP